MKRDEERAFSEIAASLLSLLLFQSTKDFSESGNTVGMVFEKERGVFVF